MESLLKCVKELKTEIKDLVEERMKEFAAMQKKSSSEIFKELCFCLLTANFSAERSMKMQEEIGDGFLSLPLPELTTKLKELGHRFPKARAGYIVNARKYKDNIKDILSLDGEAAREWLVSNIKGLGYKEASHFLRNIGYKDLAIIDFHIIDSLVKHKIIEKPISLTKKRYKEIEGKLKQIARKLDTNPASLDLFLWYHETGKVLK